MSLSLLGSNLAFRSASDRAIINAPAITLSNQFEGTVTGAPPAAGTGIHRGQVLCSIADDHLDASRLQQLIADSTVTDQQIHSNTPYNTYLHKGLPPGPIASPGNAAIEAALRPAAGNWLYFVTEKNGVTNFSSTLAGLGE